MSTKEMNGTPGIFEAEGDPISRYTKAKSEWDNRIGNARVQAFNWRLVALISLGIIFVLVCGLIYQSSKSMVTPYVIEVDSNTGMARAVGPAKEANYSPKDEEIKYFLAQFVLNSRSVPLDPIVYKNDWTNAYALMTPNAANKMNNVMQKDSQLAMLGRQTVQPTITNIVPIAQNSNSYQVRWKEEVYSLDGGKKEVIPMTGIFTITFGKPKTERDLLMNPLSIYIQDFNWSKDM